MSPPPGAGGVGLGIAPPGPGGLVRPGLPFPLPISKLPRNRRMRGPVPIQPLPPAAAGSVDSGAHSYPPTPRTPLFSRSDLLDRCDEASVSTVEEDDPPGGKKRKVPVPLAPGSDADADTGRDGADRNPPRSAREDTSMGSQQSGASPSVRHQPGSSFSLLLAQRRALFQKRKAGMIALYLDAQSAVAAMHSTAGAGKTADGKGTTSTAASAKHDHPSLPDVGAFERLLPVLEDISTWAPDAPGWRDGDDAAKPVPRRTLERWRTGFARRKRVRMERVPVARSGWAPEGSFELDIQTNASKRSRTWTRERAAMTRLAQQLRALVLATNSLPSQTETSPRTPSVPVTPSTIDTAPDSSKKSKKKKKKKRTTLANEGNPHHVDKYRPSRPVPVSDPYEPWPQHASLLFPPPMRVLAARPGGKDVRPGEDEYICPSCQYALFYGTEAQRVHAIKQRKAELARREKLRARMYDASHGNRARRHSSDTNGHDDEEDDEDDYEDEEDDLDEGCGYGHGRCTCGRALNDEAKPPDKPP